MLYNLAGTCDPAAIVVGDDVRVRPVRQLRSVRRPRQHLFDLQSEDARGQRACVPRTARSHRLPVLLPFPRRQPDSDEQRRHVVRIVGHRDRTTGHIVPRPHRRRHVAQPVARHADFCIR